MEDLYMWMIVLYSMNAFSLIQYPYDHKRMVFAIPASYHN